MVSMITTQAMVQDSKRVELGHVTEAFRRMGTAVTGGRTGSVLRIGEQFNRFFSTMISIAMRVEKEGFQGFRGKNMILAEEMELYWSARDKDVLAPGLFQNTITLSQPYFDYIRTNSTPVDLITYHSFQSPRDQDWYAWLSRRVYGVSKAGYATLVKWDDLYMQFGPVLRNNRPKFRKDFKDFMLLLLTKHPDLRVKLQEEGVSIAPSTLIIPEEKKGFVQT
ncbi:MAG: hypothetical protein HKM05_10540 [Spirochaetales bacterium]|nr:hypothetical protein [Spirochaetales bacterium]